MRRRSLITFVVLNVLISLGVALAVISALGSQNQGGNVPRIVTVEILITATPDPDAMRNVVIITATPMPGTPQVVGLPTGLFEGPDLTRSPVATLDPELLAANVSLQGTATALPENCILHTVASGDTPFGIAELYGADGFALMEVNGLDEFSASMLQIGDTLIVPLEGCPLTAADVVEDEPEVAVALASADSEETSEATSTESAVTPTPRPTLTVPPTATNAQLAIVDLREPGDISSEAVEIINNGTTVDLNGWTLSDDAQGEVYTFTERRLFSGGRITLFTRAGMDTPVVLYWGRDEAVWQPGDVVTLRDANGAVQSTFRVPEAIDLN